MGGFLNFPPPPYKTSMLTTYSPTCIYIYAKKGFGLSPKYCNTMPKHYRDQCFSRTTLFIGVLGLKFVDDFCTVTSHTVDASVHLGMGHHGHPFS